MWSKGGCFYDRFSTFLQNTPEGEICDILSFTATECERVLSCYRARENGFVIRRFGDSMRNVGL
jgi:hypothetical protein